MPTWLIAAFVIGSLLVVTLVVIVLFWLEARSAERRRERELFAADGPWDRSSREIHHMTVPEMQETNAEFDALIEANFPNQT